MVGDELRIERLPARARIAVAQITGTAENLTLHKGCTRDEAVAAIEADLQPFDEALRRLILAHSAHSYVHGEFQYQRDAELLLEQLGADLDLAVQVAQDRARREHPESRTPRQRRLLER